MYVCRGKGDSVRLLAGSLFLISILLSFLSRYFLFIGAVPAVMLLVSYFTGFCPTEQLLHRAGVKERFFLEDPKLKK